MKCLSIFIAIIFIAKFTIAQGPQQMFWALNKCPLLLRQISEEPSGAYSLRRLNCNYTGFAIRVRNSSTGSTRDIGFNNNGDLDTVGLKSFIGSNSATVVRWYDQSGNNRTAQQNTVANQPRIVNSGVLVTSSVSKAPSIEFSGNQWLDCGVSVQTMTNSGAEGSVFMVLTASTFNQTHFGAVSTSGSLPSPNRWATHINWSDNNLYFDAGNCCAPSNNRVVASNGSNVNVWRQYSLVRTSTVSTIRARGVTLATNSGFPASVRTTTTSNFWIGAPSGWTVNSMSPMTGRMAEIIIFPTGVVGNDLNAIETNQKVYYGLL